MASRRVADWRFPDEKQARVEETLRRMQAAAMTPDPAPEQSLPEYYWNALLSDPRAKGRPALPIEQRRLSEVPRPSLRAECDKCFRIVEIQTIDAVRLYGPHTIWKDVAMKLASEPGIFAGVGVVSCGEFGQDYGRAPQAFENLYFNWTQGYMSGLNVVRHKLPAAFRSDLGAWGQRSARAFAY